MKNFILIFCTIFLIQNACLASSHTQTLSKVENVLYGFQYDNENDNDRLSRIEKTVYGASSNGNIENRIKKLKNDISADLMGQEIKPKEDTFADEDYYTIEEEPVADTNIQYPAVDELEMRVFKQVYQSKDIKQRLTDLETKTFGKNFTQDDLATRTDRLKAEIKPESLMNNAIAQSSNSFYDDDVITLDKDYHLDRYDSPYEFDYDAYNTAQKTASRGSFFSGKKSNINSIENTILKRTYPNETMDKRLSRLERTIFGTEFQNEDNQSRLERISVAYKAQKSSSKYDMNKFGRNMATAMQIGTILLMVLACIL